MSVAAGAALATPSALDAIGILSEIVARPPLISWRHEGLQPRPLHRARVKFEASHTYAYNDDRDVIYRRDLQTLWRAAHLGRSPLEGDLVTVMTFAGRKKDRLLRHPRPDETNLRKAIEDAGNPAPRDGWKGLWLDDRQLVLNLGWIRGWGNNTRPVITVDVWSLGSLRAVAAGETDRGRSA